MAIKNPKKQFNFRVSFPWDPTLPVFSVQEFKLPDVEVTPDEHGQGNVIVKTAGIVNVTTATLSRIMPGGNTDGIDSAAISRFFWSWLNEAQNMMTGGGFQELVYKHDVLVHELAQDGVTVINTVILIGAWVTKINGKTYKRAESGNLIEEVELSVDYVTIV